MSNGFHLNPRLGWSAIIVEVVFLGVLAYLAKIHAIDSSVVGQLMIGYLTIRGGGLIARGMLNGKNGNGNGNGNHSNSDKPN